MDKHIGYTLPLTTTGESIRIAFGDSTHSGFTYSDHESLPIFQGWEKDTGVKLVLELMPKDTYNDVMSVRLAASSDLPDLFQIAGNWNDLAANGVISPLNELIDTYMTHLITWWFAEASPRARGLMTAPDGEIWFFRQENNPEDPSFGTNPVGIQVRKDWLNDLGLDEPKTLDDFYNMLVAFKSYDPFGDGSVQVVPFHPHYGAPNFRIFQTFYGIGWAYGLPLHMHSNGFQIDDNGKMYYMPTSDRMKELVTTLNKWYSEGLIDPDFMNYDPARTGALITGSGTGCYQNRVMNAANNYNTALPEQAGRPDAMFVPIIPLKGPYGDQFCENDYNPVGGIYWGIAGSSDKKELVVKWLDYTCFSPLAVEQNDYGIEGDTFVWNNGRREFTAQVIDNPNGMNDALKRIGAMRHTDFVSCRWDNNIELLRPRGEELFNRIMSILPYNRPFLSMPLSLPEESDIIHLYLTDLETYVDEMLIGFIIGTVPLSDWNKYVSDVSRLQIDQLQAVKQAQYDRSLIG